MTDEKTNNPAMGQFLGRYRVLQKLGAGGMGEVFLAEDAELERKVALKILPAEVAADSERIRRFVQEAKAASALNHPNILTIYEIGQAENARFIATEFIAGETLRERLNGGALALGETLDIAVQIASALQAAHAAGIVHRDIKPENIMLRDSDGLVKILDFGIAKLSEKKPETIDAEAATAIKAESTNPGVIIGTANYMSPEQARGKAVDARSDIFSFGIVLYEMLSGKRAFAGETAMDAISAILHKEPVPLDQILPEIPLEIESIVSKTLKKEAGERYQSAKDLLNDLKEAGQQLEFQNKFGAINASSGGAKSTEAETQMFEANPTDEKTSSTEENQKTTSSAEYIFGEVKKHKRSFTFAVLALLIASFAGFGWWFYANRAAGTKQIESIAVLPFKNESGNSEVEYLSDGMTETLIGSLSQLPNLNVKARSSVFRYKGKSLTPPEIGKELNVQALLNGVVIQRGQDLILNVELVDAQTENVLWSANYNRKQTDLVSLQSEIARDVSQKLKTKLSGADEQRLAKNYTENTEAYQMYLKGRYFWNKRNPQDLQKAIEYFNQAIAVDPNFALAYTGIADAYSVAPNYGNKNAREVMPKAKEAALKALSLDNSLAEAHAAYGNTLTQYDYNFAEAEREYKRAIELNPNYATAHQWYAELLIYQTRFDEGFAEFQRALEIDPLSLAVNWSYGINLYNARRYDEAITQMKKTLELDPNFQRAHLSLAIIYQAKGKYAESVEAYAKAQELMGNRESAEAIREAFAKDGDRGYRRFMTDERRRAETTPYGLAGFYAQLGEKDKAFAELEKAYESRAFQMVLLKVDSRLDPLRDDPRFEELLRRVGFTN